MNPIRIPDAEQGSTLLEMAVIIPLAVLFIAAIASFGPYVHISFAVRQAAFDCAVAAAQSLDAGQGFMQGYGAGEQSFAGFALDEGSMQLNLTGSWERGGQVLCQVSYRIPVEKMPIKGLVSMPGSYTYAVQLPVQQWKSTWK